MAVLCAAAVIAGSPFVSAQDASPPAAAHDTAFWDTLMNHLQLAAQAQRDLKAVGVADREKLKTLADGATDPEIKAQLIARLEGLDEDLMLNPAPLSLNVK